jgi:RNA polymerase sigma-70 factor (ECF subfamily)
VDGWPGQEELVDAHYGRLRRLCELLLSDREEAKEVVQEVFMKAHEAAVQSKAPNDWAAWLTQVTLNSCRDRSRSGWWIRFRRWSDPPEQLPLRAWQPSPMDAAIGEETRRQIWLAFRRLPDRQREVFVLRYIEEWSTDAVAKGLGLRPGSVKRHLFRAIRRLRAALGGAR